MVWPNPAQLNLKFRTERQSAHVTMWNVFLVSGVPGLMTVEKLTEQETLQKHQQLLSKLAVMVYYRNV